MRQNATITHKKYESLSQPISILICESTQKMTKDFREKSLIQKSALALRITRVMPYETVSPCVIF